MAEPILSRQRALVAKVEAAYKTDPNASAADNSIETVNLQLTPLDAQYAPRNQDRAILGAREQVLTIARVRAQFGVYLAGAGSADPDAEPKWGPLVRACGFAATQTQGTGGGGKATNAALQAYYGKTVFTPVSAAFESAWLKAYLGRNEHVMRGCRGTFEITVNSGELPMWNFDFQGLWEDLDTAARLPALSTGGFQPPRPITFAQTPTCQLHGEDVVMNRLSISAGNAVEHIDDPGAERITIVDREVTGSISVQLPLQEAKDWFAAARSVTTGALRVVHGADGADEAGYHHGRIVEITAPKVQVTNPRIGESQGRHMVEMDLRFIPSAAAGNDEIAITTR